MTLPTRRTLWAILAAVLLLPLLFASGGPARGAAGGTPGKPTCGTGNTPVCPPPTPTDSPTPTATETTPDPTTSTTDPAPTATETTPGSDLPAEPTGATSSTGWVRTWGDDFNDPATLGTQWTPEDNRTNNNVLSKKEDVAVVGGNLKVWITDVDATGKYRGGFAETNPTFSTTNSRYLFRVGHVLQFAALMPGSCLPPAATCAEDIWDFPGLLWVRGADPWPSTGELDPYEGLGGAIGINYHYGTTDTADNGRPVPACCYGNTWHTVTVDRTPTAYLVYIDGTLQRTITNHDPGQGMSAVINIGVSGSRPKHLGEEGASYVAYVADYVRG
jgi:hypothetical protein